MRPHELMQVQPEDLSPPSRSVMNDWSLLVCPQERGARTKTGAVDDSVTLDCKWLNWMAPVWAALARAPHGRPVWTFTYAQLVAKFKNACLALDVSAVPYMMRHSGPSIDRAGNYRNIEEIRKRGRWASHKSVVRYEKAGRLSKAWHDLPAVTREKCMQSEVLLEATVLGTRSAARSRGRPR